MTTSDAALLFAVGAKDDGHEIPASFVCHPCADSIASTILSMLPSGSTNLDMTVSAEGKYLFSLLSGTGAVAVYTINSDGTLIHLADIDGLTPTVGFNGIAAL
jgi:6-phosphogluconolactonase (cycloisomerase 2 family)